MNWLTIEQAYREYYGKDLPENKRTATVYKSKFKADIISGTIPLEITKLHDGSYQVSKNSIDQYKKKRLIAA